MMRGRDQTLSRFGLMFREHLGDLSEVDISSFLDFEKNCHWTGLQRQESAISVNMPAVRSAIKVLRKRKEFGDDGGRRFDDANRLVRGLGEGIMTPILFVAFAEDYGVWNAKSTFGLQTLDLWITTDKGDSRGRMYEKVNATLLSARNSLNKMLPPGQHPVDLWTIDYCWHAMKVMSGDGRLEPLIGVFRRTQN